MDERGSSISDGQPLVKIKQALNGLKSEITEMDLRAGVVQHTLLLSKVNTKSAMVQDMNAGGGHQQPFSRKEW